jgi:hypothetical protein
MLLKPEKWKVMKQRNTGEKSYYPQISPIPQIKEGEDWENIDYNFSCIEDSASRKISHEIDVKIRYQKKIRVL